MNKTIEQRCKKELYTRNYPCACSGYLLDDGSWLDLILKEDVDRGGYYRNDHRTIHCYLNRVSEDTSGTDAMYRFMARGHIRYMPESGCFEFIKLPNQKQIRAMMDARRCSGCFRAEHVRYSKKTGYYRSVWSTEYWYDFLNYVSKKGGKQ